METPNAVILPVPPMPAIAKIEDKDTTRENEDAAYVPSVRGGGGEEEEVAKSMPETKDMNCGVERVILTHFLRISQL